MFKMTAFGVDTGSQTTLPLINGVIHNALFQSTPHGDKDAVAVRRCHGLWSNTHAAA